MATPKLRPTDWRGAGAETYKEVERVVIALCNNGLMDSADYDQACRIVLDVLAPEVIG